MTKKRILMFIALFIIMAVCIGPVLLQPENQPAVPPWAGNTESSGEPQHEAGAANEQLQPNPAAPDASSAAGNEEQPPDMQTGQEPAPVADTGEISSAEQGCRIGIAVVGMGGEPLYGPAHVRVRAENKWGITALGALEATGLEYATKPTWPDFVDSIAGQACRGVSGWMYMVNGEIPMHLADKHPVKEGDQVIWWYSESMDQAPPVWDELLQVGADPDRLQKGMEH